MELGEKQELFAKLEAEWVLWVISHEGYKLRQGEGRILQLGPSGKGRKAIDVATRQHILVKDVVHMDLGAHYTGVGKDWQLFVNGEYVTSSENPAWVFIGTNWETRHPLCRWGGRWGDGNHISLEHEGRK